MQTLYDCDEAVGSCGEEDMHRVCSALLMPGLEETMVPKTEFP